MTDEDRQYKEKMKNGVQQLNDKAEEKAKKELMKKIIRIIGIKGIAIGVVIAITASLLSVVFFAAFVDYNDWDRKNKATSAKAQAIGDEPLDSILSVEDGKYKITYDEKTGKDALRAILEDNDMNFEDFNNEEIECLYSCLRAEWATTYPNLGGSVDNKDVDSEYVQGVITVNRGKAGDDKENIVKLEYKPYEEFTTIEDGTALNYFSMKDGNIILSNWSSNEVIYTPSDSMPDDIKKRYTNTGEQISITEVAVDYRNMIGIHTISFEFLLSLLINTENVDFVSELANLAFNSTIEITVYDNMTEITTVETEHTHEETTYKKWVDYYITNTTVENLAGGIPGRKSSTITENEKDKEISSTEKDIIDYTLTTKRIVKSNSCIVELTNVSSWIADIKNEYTYNPKYGTEENLGLGTPNEYTEEKEEENISFDDSDVETFISSKESTTSRTDSFNNTTYIYTKTCTITGAKRKGTLNGTNELTKNTSQTNEYKYESGAKQTSNMGEQFADIYRKYPGVQSVIDSTSSWLFDLLDDTESTVDYVSIMKYLLYVCTGENYGVTDIDDIMETIDALEITNLSTASGSNSFNQFIRYLHSWEAGREAPTYTDENGNNCYKVTPDRWWTD